MNEKSKTDIQKITADVVMLLGTDASGHGMDHVERVLNLALAFAKNEGANTEIVTLAALLHDVDDYKIFGQDSADNLTNATRILAEYNIDQPVKDAVLGIIRSMGYNKYLDGIRPTTLEGMIVSDADMCDAIGAIGIIRTHAYAIHKGNEFFDKTIPPEIDSFSAKAYRDAKKTHSVQHFFDKLLKIPAILMTESGLAEGQKRNAIMIDFLRELFEEENAQDWLDHLKTFNPSTD